jgi:predicted transcriptional regulator
MGALEGEVLEVLWSADRPRTPAQVLEALDSELAYTTVMTILSRLWEKGLAARVKQGRAYAYEATVSEADLAAARMSRELERSSDRMATIGRFVDRLEPGEAKLLLDMLEQMES